MNAKLHWTLVSVATLGGIAAADPDDSPQVMGVPAAGEVSHRGVAQDYLVLPSGGELTGQMRFLTSQPIFGDEPMRFSDLALFGLAGRWSLFRKLEVSGQIDLLAKQPSFTDEKPWQSVGLGLRSPLGHRAAIAVSGGGGHLIDHAGMWVREAISIQWRKPIAEVLTFDVAGGLDSVALTAPRSTSAVVTEVSAAATALFREPTGHWGSWVGIGYAIPVHARGEDPTTGLAIDPQPRLDFKIGTVLSLVREWDLFAEYAIVDRGDLANAATRLPILDGGFDQHQVMLGVTRHVTGKRHRPRNDGGDDALQLGLR
ncbi:MAG: hypothetical protein H6Q90_2235 [Deltaproteobacteria bacterium]|nr:hypothetical protein [Deltaproteobacteria bacterium]